ncbi:MAG TPA: tetratricopeptide repeat protein [Bacteroidales bacterium]|nr:tetratricopeptide repeat protein [Bacteroidales bacterium]
MKKHFLIFGLLLLSTFLYSQISVDSLVEVGIQYHDNGEFVQAIETYKTALEIEPNSPLVNYEIALTYMYSGDYQNAIKHSDKVIKRNDKYLLQAYLVKGSCLDYLGKTKESIKLFKKGIKKFGDDHLLYYNLGYNYYNIKEFDKAEKAFIKAINTKANHASSHLFLGYLMYEKNQRVQSLLSLHFFLLLEPNSERSQNAYNLLQSQLSGGVERNQEEPGKIDIFLSPDQLKSEFGTIDMMITILEASKSLEENEGKSDDQMFIENTTSFFKILGEHKTKENTGFWWDFYVPFFYLIAESEHIDTYCYYISQSTKETAVDWLKENEKRVTDFAKWLSEE